MGSANASTSAVSPRGANHRASVGPAGALGRIAAAEGDAALTKSLAKTASWASATSARARSSGEPSSAATASEAQRRPWVTMPRMMK